MIRRIFLIIAFIFINNINAQDINYGFILGNTAETTYSNGNVEFLSAENFTFLQISGGIYVDVPLTDKLGIKTDLNFNGRKLKTNKNFVPDDFKLSFLHLNPNLKISFNDNYYKGLYALIGPKLSFLLSSKYGNIDAKDSFKSSSFGASLGLGGNLNKYLALEGKIDCGLSNLLDNTSTKLNFVGFYLALNISLNKLINK